MITEQERKVVDLLAKAWNEFLLLPESHPMTQQEMCTAIHTCQRIVLARCGVRLLNDDTQPK